VFAGISIKIAKPLRILVAPIAGRMRRIIAGRIRLEKKTARQKTLNRPNFKT
jgi:hypothetical protein